MRDPFDGLDRRIDVVREHESALERGQSLQKGCCVLPTKAPEQLVLEPRDLGQKLAIGAPTSGCQG